MKKFMCLSALIMMISLSACGYGERKIEKATEDTAKKYFLTPTTAPAPGTSGEISTSLDICGQEGILILTAAYYTAMEEDNTSALMSLVSNPELISDDYFSKYENIVDVNVKHVYTMEGTGVVDTIVYVYYEVFIDGIETAVPSLDELFITSENGAYYIYNGKIPTEDYNKIIALSDADGVQQLVTSVNRAFLDAMSADEALKNYLDTL